MRVILCVLLQFPSCPDGVPSGLLYHTASYQSPSDRGYSLLPSKSISNALTFAQYSLQDDANRKWTNLRGKALKDAGIRDCVLIVRVINTHIRKPFPEEAELLHSAYNNFSVQKII